MTTAEKILGKKTRSSVASYLDQCCIRSLAETESGEEFHHPPTSQEARDLIRYLRDQGLDPVVVGSTAIFHHVGGDTKTFRPTVDLDLFVKRAPKAPLKGWVVDRSSVGVTSWKSPSGGTVDFVVGGEPIGSGHVSYPRSVKPASTSDSDYPVADVAEVLKMKLNSNREKDLFDAISLARRAGLPDAKALGKLNQTQRENYDLVKLWIESKPEGNYGE